MLLAEFLPFCLGGNVLTLNILNCFKGYKRSTSPVLTFCVISWILFNRRTPDSQWSNPTCCLSCTVNNIPADALATLGARASTGMVLTHKASEELKWNEFLPVMLIPAWSGNRGLFYYRKTSCISRTKSQNLNVSHLVLQLSLPNPLNPTVKLRMKM